MHRNVLFCCLKRKEMNFINYFFEVVLPQILDYFERNTEQATNYFLLEIFKNDKKYQEQIKRILETNKQNKKGE